MFLFGTVRGTRVCRAAGVYRTDEVAISKTVPGRPQRTLRWQH